MGRVSVDPLMAAEIMKLELNNNTAGPEVKGNTAKTKKEKAEKVIERNDMRPFKLEYDKSDYVRNTNQAQFNIEVHSIAPPRYESMGKHFLRNLEIFIA